MDDKTEQLRDIFLEVSEEGTVTETQAETRGSLAPDEEGDDERLREVVAEMCERESFDTAFDLDTYVGVVRGFYDDADDGAIAADLGRSVEEVFDARMDLHLIRRGDTDGIDVCELRDRGGGSAEALAAAVGVDVETARRYRRVVATQDAARAANHRYRTEFEELLTDAALAGEYAGGVHEDGLDEAAEGIESDVSF